MSDETELTEFAELDPQELHLVPKGATGFPLLLAKGIDEAISEVQTEQRSHQTERKQKMGKKELRAALAKAEADLERAGLNRGADPRTAESIARQVGRAPISAGQAISAMKAAADNAERTGDAVKAKALRQEVATFKLQIAERHRQDHPQPSRLGPNAVELFQHTGSLGEDTAVKGI
jgi:hypothetical protein